MRRSFGILSMAIFWSFTAASIALNRSWWNILDHTLSKLGRSDLANHPWLFSMGVIVGGIFMILHGISMVALSETKMGVVGSSYVILSGVFMILVGIFPDGTKPHDFIALSAFLLFYTGNLLYGLPSKDRKIKIGFTIIFSMAIGGLLSPIWPSLGVLEIYGLSLVLLECVLIIFERS